MTSTRLIAGGVAGVAGLIVGVGAVFLGGWLATDTSPGTEVHNIDAQSGFVQGSVEYGSREGAEPETN